MHYAFVILNCILSCYGCNDIFIAVIVIAINITNIIILISDMLGIECSYRVITATRNSDLYRPHRPAIFRIRRYILYVCYFMPEYTRHYVMLMLVI